MIATATGAISEATYASSESSAARPRDDSIMPWQAASDERTAVRVAPDSGLHGPAHRSPRVEPMQ